MHRLIKIPSFWRRSLAIAAALITCSVLVSPASAFFPCKKPKPKCDDNKFEDPKCPPKKPPHCPPPDDKPPDDPPRDDPPGDSIPEIDAGSMAGALGVLLSGTLMLTDRRRRK